MSRVDEFNERFALAITSRVSTMWCAYLFCLIAFISLPATLVAAGFVPKGVFPHFLIANGLIITVAWCAQTFIQLVLLAVIMVGQDAASKAASAATAAAQAATEQKINETHDASMAELELAKTARTAHLEEMRAFHSEAREVHDLVRALHAATIKPAPAKRPTKAVGKKVATRPLSPKARNT